MYVMRIIITVLWSVFILYWLLSAVGAKRSIRDQHWLRSAGVRLLIMIITWLVFWLLAKQHLTFTASPTSFVMVIGTMLVATGIGLCLWARRCLGKNWGMPMSRIESSELITTGPYRLIRHPIYTGLITAFIGTALAINWLLLLPFVLAAVYFVYCAIIEEQTMIQKFPAQYPDYKSRSKMLIPFIL